ncbi:MAG: hypothetical protein ACQESR_02730 [Planctomycetota bacterium]
MKTTLSHRILAAVFLAAMLVGGPVVGGENRHGNATSLQPCRIRVVEKSSGQPVPLVELVTTHNVRFVTDNAGVIAFDLPELMGRETWFHVNGHGYEVPEDGFGYRGVRLTPTSGGELEIQVKRTIIAKRLGRLTGGGLFAESRKAGLEPDGQESGVLGCDSVQNALYCGKLFWAWGDTTLPHYPLGIFHMTAAVTAPRPLESFEPPLRLKFDYIRDDSGRPRGVAKMPGKGPTWLNGLAALPDETGKERLVATYRKIEPPLETYEIGLCVWDDQTSSFSRHRVLWNKKDSRGKMPDAPEGHPVFQEDEQGRQWVLFGDPFPELRCPARFEAWEDPSKWRHLEAPEAVRSASGEQRITPHRGSISWNHFRERWVAVFVEHGGSPSVLGELWYAEADSPTGPWGPAVKVLSHENYSFYNPKLHSGFTPDDSSVLLFEGTYTQQFADDPTPTPRYDYNQILYRLDLDDPRLKAAH